MEFSPQGCTSQRSALSCLFTSHSPRAGIKSGSSLPSSRRGAAQADCLLLQGMQDTSQGLSVEFRMSRGCHGIQAHSAQPREFQLRAVIIPKQIKAGKFVGGEGQNRADKDGDSFLSRNLCSLIFVLRDPDPLSTSPAQLSLTQTPAGECW